jgi:hypothetical protein
MIMSNNIEKENAVLRSIPKLGSILLWNGELGITDINVKSGFLFLH